MVARAAGMRSYMGDPRGTLGRQHAGGRDHEFHRRKTLGRRRSYSDDLLLVERFTRVGADNPGVPVTINDPKTFTAPWTATFPITHEPGYQIFEYACHEGNYAMRNRLSAARALEAKDAKDAAGKK